MISVSEQELLFLKDHLFGSPSAAGCALIGGENNRHQLAQREGAVHQRSGTTLLGVEHQRGATGMTQHHESAFETEICEHLAKAGLVVRSVGRRTMTGSWRCSQTTCSGGWRTPSLSSWLSG